MDISEIKNEIVTLEQGDTNWQNIQKLSWLYTVYDHMTHAENNNIIVHTEKGVMPDYAGEFGEAVSGVNIDSLMNILSEHMSVIKILHPKEYQAVLDRITEIPR